MASGAKEQNFSTKMTAIDPKRTQDVYSLNMIKSGLTWVLLIVSSVALAGDYVLPEPDHIPSNVAKPCFNGVITSVKPNYITVKNDIRNSANKSLKIIVDNKTSIFTVYGGFVMSSQLISGQKLKIWYQGKSCTSPDNPLSAARIMLASKRPGDGWPKE